ncbi:hypothetical protein [Acanthopleuribacter pedis]|uniref:Response regulatory domain-containing protein n=1 Tax=Acanthopleuribacter pedis TaxID=442870 RepID=A0A8J7Q726_9BACT|nr:hypothetical protein [Acanthopleuribacter pedis]MBO1321772.1 hypothetical protein [Acanthopleuribacter pedis]
MKKHPHPKVRSHHELSHVMQTMIAGTQKANLFIEGKKIRGSLLEFNETCLFFQFPKLFQLKFRNIAATHIKVSFFVEGKIYYSLSKVLGFGKFAGEEAIRLKFPGYLSIDDEYGLADVYTESKIPLVFTSFDDGQKRKGSMVNFGKKGIDFVAADGGEAVHKSLSVGTEVAFHFELRPNQETVCKAKVLYIHEDEGIAGAGFLDFPKDEAEEKSVSEWILQCRRLQKLNANHFVLPGSREAKKIEKLAARAAGNTEEEDEKMPKEDNRPVLFPGDPKVLIVSDNFDRVVKLGRALKKDFGILKNNGELNDVVNVCKFLKPSMLLIDEQYRVGHGFELCSRFSKSPRADLPVIMVGTEKDREEKENRAMREGAAGFLVIDPLNNEQFLQRVRENFELFVGPLNAAKAKAKPKEKPKKKTIEVHDFEPVRNQGPKPILICTPDEDLLERCAITLEAKHGILRTRGIPKKIQAIVSEHKPALILLHEQLDHRDGFETCDQLMKAGITETPMLIIGSGKDLRVKQNKALQCGAVDYLVTDPYDGILVQQKVTETLALFCAEENPPVESHQPDLTQDYPDTKWREGQSYVLFGSENRPLLEKIGHALGDHTGILFSKGPLGNIEMLAQLYDTTLIVLDEKMGSVTGFDIAKRLTSGPLEEIPVVIMGKSNDLKKMKNLAVREGALEYLPYEPFVKDLFLGQIRDVLSMFR